MIVGASFDPPEESRAFAEDQSFGYRLLSDVDRSVARAYEVLRPAGDQYEDFPLRISYLIDPGGVIQRSYVVADVRGHAAAVLADLAELQGRS